MNRHGAIPFAAPDVTEEDVEAVARVLRSGWITSGGECAAFEVELADFLGGEIEVVAVSSCTAALEIAAAYFELKEGDLFAVPTWTFASSALALMRLGAKPVLLDIDPETLNVNLNSLEWALAHHNLSVVVLVHMGGVPVSEEAHKLCAAYGVEVIEDAAHALGATDHRGQIGSAATATCFSFYATKNLTSAEGGALVTTNRSLAAFARSFRLHGLSADAYDRYKPGNLVEYDLVHGGIKANFPDPLAAMARTQLKRFTTNQRRRSDLVESYRESLASVDGLQCIPSKRPEGSANHLMMVRLASDIDRDLVRVHLAADNIGTSVHFRPLHTLTWLDGRALTNPGGLPIADSLRRQILSLPLHTRLSDEDIGRVCSSLIIQIGRSRCGPG
jgi:dTDP-4-amino-4,6-dideoxygalactose transaminase